MPETVDSDKRGPTVRRTAVCRCTWSAPGRPTHRDAKQFTDDPLRDPRGPFHRTVGADHGRI